MPYCSCHPISAHKKLRLPDWFVSNLMLDRALDAILRRIHLDRAHDIPYLAGYSTDGRIIYIDRHLPRFFTFKGRKIAVDRYLVLHEAVEKTLLDELGLHYQHAHQIATRAEEAAIRADNIGWSEYDRFMQRFVKSIGDERLTKVPANLDQKPYRDEHDHDLLRRMRTAEVELSRAKATGKAKAKGKATGKATGKAGTSSKAKSTSKPRSSSISTSRSRSRA